MGTTYRIVLPTLPLSIAHSKLEQGIHEIIHSIDREMSTYKPESDVSRFNRTHPQDWVNVSAQVVEVVSISLYLSLVTNGSFDITIAPLVDLWGFGPSSPITTVPNKKQIQRSRQQVDYHQLEVRMDPPQLRKKRPLQIDLSAIAKGYAVDRVAEYLDELLCKHYMVEIGGEIRVRGQNIHGNPWRIGIEQPSVNLAQLHRRLAMTNIALATSGDYRNFVQVHDKRYAHIINPQSGLPVNHTLRSVTVLDESCAQADAFATALFVMGLEKGLQFANHNALPVYFIIKNNGKLETHSSHAFQHYMD